MTASDRRAAGRRLSLRAQLLLLQVVIVVATVGLTGVASVYVQQQRIREGSQTQMIGVARSVATLPTIVEAMDDPDPSSAIQPVAELIREASGVTYVVVTDTDGIRLSHPDPELIGERVSTDPTPLASGQMFTGTQTGSLGESWRVKLPIVDARGDVVGMASVGVLESELRSTLMSDLWWLGAFLLAAAMLGTVLAAFVARLVWRRIHRVEPEEIAALLETRDAMLHSIGEGIVALDTAGRVALVNDEAQRLLGLEDDPVGAPASRVLDPTLLAHVDSGSEQETWVLAGERVLLAVPRRATVAGQGVGSVVILRDRTELRETLASLEGARDQAQALRVQRHEFANTLHTVSGLLELGRVDEAVRFISRTPGTGAGRSLDLPGLHDAEVEALVVQKQHVAAERGIDVVVDPDSTWAFDGTSDVLTVLGNLVDNAIEAVVHDGTVQIDLDTRDGLVTVTVGDSGPGVPTDDILRLFEPGYSSKTGGAAGSDRQAHGIGLALVARVARRRGGTATVARSALGGAEFVVSLQQADAPVPSPVTESVAP